MPRTPRDFEPGRVYHLISRLVDRNWYIKTEDERRLYLKLLGRSFEKSDWKLIGNSIMSNHTHLCSVAGTHAFSNLMRRVHAPFATWMNRAYGRIGTMFVRGPKAIEVSDERVAAVLAYIHNNPVRAGVVSSPEESTWTSHRAYMGLDRIPRWLDVNEGLRRSGFSDPLEFTGWVSTNPNVDDVAAHVEAAFGDSEVEVGFDSEVGLEPVASPSPRSPAVSADKVVEATAAVLEVPRMCILSRGRGSRLARQVVVHCAGMVGATGVETGNVLGLTQQAVSKIQLRDPENAVLEVAHRVLEQLGVRR